MERVLWQELGLRREDIGRMDEHEVSDILDAIRVMRNVQAEQLKRASRN